MSEDADRGCSTLALFAIVLTCSICAAVRAAIIAVMDFLLQMR